MKFLNLLKGNYQIIIILIIAIILRFYHLDFQSLWMDEIYTMNVSSPKLTFKELHDVVVEKEGFPYLYFVLLRLLYSITEYSGLIARMLSSVAGVVGVYYIYILGKHLYNRNAGLIAAFLLSINDFHILYSQEARPYSLFFLFAVVSFYRLSISFYEQKTCFSKELAVIPMGDPVVVKTAKRY